MRDYRKLRAFELADEFVIMVYRATSGFPTIEQFGLTSQIRRAAVSIPSNIVEGSARPTLSDYRRFLGIAYGSTQEVGYQISLEHRLGYLDDSEFNNLHAMCDETGRVLHGLIRSLRQ